MKTILVTSGKSGCGVSSVAAALCGALGDRNRRVVLCDIGSGLRGQNFLLGVAEETLYDVSDVLEGRCSLAEAAIHPPNQPFLLLQASVKLDWLPRTAALRALQEATGSQYDYLVLDCPVGTGALQKRLAPCADLLTLVTTVGALPIAAAAKAGEWWEDQGAPQQRVIFNRLGRRLPEDSGVKDLDEALDRIGARLLGVIPEESPLRDSRAIRNIASRLDGEYQPLLPCFLR